VHSGGVEATARLPGGSPVPESGGENRRRGNRNHAQAGEPAPRLTKWTIVMAVATIVVAIGSCVASWMAWYSFKAQRDDAHQLLQAQIASELDREFDSKEMRRARRVLASELLTKSANASDYRVFDFFDKIATSTLCAAPLLKASSFFTR